MYARKHKGLSQQELADAARFERTYVTRVEGGSRFASLRFAEVCDQVFGTPGSFVRLRHRVSERGHAGWFIPYMKLESEASVISDYSNSFVMGMLQTPEYAEAVFRAAHPRESDTQIRGRVEARMRRRELMERDKPPLLWVILSEWVLRQEVGSPSVMVGQLQHLLAAATNPHITLQVLPFTAGAPASGLSFILLTQDAGDMVLYSETTGHGQVNDSPAAVRSWSATYERLRAAAEPEVRSLRLIHSIMEEHAK
ncbi:helix-turn-helix transcriptional regulator [Streptomyces sp. 150FB]|uniref:helix-turn-helix domain-containing protein n=1 Tax=Streptomyces sp. 150FB TaxID=1576605 RepID=UPI00099BFE0D|nr:helix-turn-helix transcriptional regulator [Streptomyces sp. 150FB]